MYRNVVIILPESNFNEQEFNTVKTHLEKNYIKVFIASDATGLCTGEHGLKVKSDMQLYNIHINNFKAVIFIGGKGVEEYWNNILLHKLIKKSYENKTLLAAICAAPVILAKSGILSSKNAVCYPDNKKDLTKEGANYTDLPVIQEGKIITARDEISAQQFVESIIASL